MSLDLFGSDVSTNAANYFTAGLKGRFHEDQRDDDHRLDGRRHARCPKSRDGRIADAEAPALTALNADLREQYIADCAKGVSRWNRALAGTGHELRLPHHGFNRKVGLFSEHHVSPDGRLLSRRRMASSGAADGSRPTTTGPTSHRSCSPCTSPGRFASWLTPPGNGINTKPVDFEYVKL